MQGKRQAQEGKPSENRRNKEGKSRPFPTVFPKKLGKPQADSRSLKENNRKCAGEHQEYDGKIPGSSGSFLCRVWWARVNFGRVTSYRQPTDPSASRHLFHPGTTPWHYLRIRPTAFSTPVHVCKSVTMICVVALAGTLPTVEPAGISLRFPMKSCGFPTE